LGTLARAQALVADGREAERLYGEAIDHLRRCRVLPQLARARLVYGEWLRRERRRRDARTELQAAYELFESMGATAFARRAAIELAATGEHPRRRSPELIGVLTPQEKRIAYLAAEGAANAEIAAQLFLSPRTVEYHLRNVYLKLGIATRSQLLGALERRRPQP
jgi:DNA-binding CsgD family transcriptional regulator